jgi:cysteine synthase
MSIEVVEIDEHLKLADYEELAYLAEPAHELRSQGEIVEDSFRGRTLWMVNSTATGGGVAEMLPKMVSILRELGIDTRWAVIGTEREEFFELTKRLHNLIHGVGEPVVSAADRELYEAVSQENAEEFRKLLRPQRASKGPSFGAAISASTGSFQRRERRGASSSPIPQPTTTPYSPPGSTSRSTWRVAPR